MGNWETIMSDIGPSDMAGATAVATGRRRRTDYVLISESSSRSLVNSSGLDGEAAYPLMRIMGDADIYPVRGVLYAGFPLGLLWMEERQAADPASFCGGFRRQPRTDHRRPQGPDYDERRQLRPIYRSTHQAETPEPTRPRTARLSSGSPAA